MLNELKFKRNLNTKHFNKGNGEFVMDSHIGHIHHFDKLDSKEFREINWDLKFDNIKRGWYFNYHSFRPFLPEYSDEWVEFRDLFDDKDQTIRYKAVCKRVKGRLVMPSEIGLKDTSVNCVIYDNAFGQGMDYILYFTRSTLKKVIRIRDGYKKSKDMVFDFEVDFPSNKQVQRGINRDNIQYKLDLTKDKEFDTDKQTLIGNNQEDGKEQFTYLRGFKVWDSEKIATVKVKYFIKDGKRYLQKIISKEFLNKSVGDIFTDTTTSYYAGAGDGLVTDYTNGGGWDLIHGEVSGGNIAVAGTGSIAEAPYVRSWASTYNRITRAYFPVDSSGLPDDANISAAIFNMWIDSVFDDNGDSYSYVSLVQTTQSDPTTLAVGDYSLIGTTEGIDSGERKDLTNVSTGQYLSFTLNSTGIGFISKTGYTKLGAREGHDLTDNAPVQDTGESGLKIYLSEQTDTANDPYLSVTYSVDLEISVSDQINITEDTTVSVQAVAPLTINVSDQVNITEDITAVNSSLGNISVNDQLNITEGITGELVDLTINVFDSLNITEGITKLGILNVNVSDQVNISEGIVKLGILYVNVSDQINATEDITKVIFDLSINVSDQANISEGITEVPEDLTVSISDQININEGIDKLGILNISVSDQLNIIEGITKLKILYINISDQVNITEDIVIELSDDLTMNISDQANLTENIDRVTSLAGINPTSINKKTVGIWQ